MIFSLPCHYTDSAGRKVECTVDYYVDEKRLAEMLGPRAAENTTRRAVELYGAIVAEVRPGSHREIS